MTGAALDRVTCRVGDGVADVRLNRPDKLNALDGPMLEALATVGDDLRADRSVRAVVLSGEGRAFCAGLDRALLLASAGGAPGERGLADRLEPRLPGRITNLLQEVAWVWHDLPVPTVAAVHGAAVGGGLQIALAADLRVVAPDARLAVLEIRWGIVPDMGGTHFLPRLVGVDRAKELTWTGREVGGAEAARIGLATRLADDPLAEARRLAAELAGRNPDAVAAAKRLLDGSLATDPADQLLAESTAMAALIGSANQVEAVNAYVEQRPPVFPAP